MAAKASSMCDRQLTTVVIIVLVKIEASALFHISG